MKVITINPETKTIEERIVSGSLESYQKLVGGLIQRGWELSATDELYVNEEGLFGDMTYWFHVKDAHQPFVGNGFIVGINHKTGDFTDTTMTVDEVKKLVIFMDKKSGTIHLAND